MDARRGVKSKPKEGKIRWGVSQMYRVEGSRRFIAEKPRCVPSIRFDYFFDLAYCRDYLIQVLRTNDLLWFREMQPLTIVL